MLLHLKSFIPISVLFIAAILTAQPAWVQQNSGTNLNLNCVYFLDVSTGYIGADLGRILKTTNGGNNWNIATTIDSVIRDIEFTDHNTGFAAYSGRIMKTTNAGIGWELSGLGVGYRISFLNSLTGYSTNGCSWLHKTTNSGFSWAVLCSTLTTGSVGKILFLNELSGFACGHFWSMSFNITTPYIWKTMNGGFNWTNSYEGQLSPYILSTIFDLCINANKGYAVGIEGSGQNPYFYYSDNLNSWTKSPIGGRMYSVKFVNNNKGWLCGQSGSIFATTNGGVNFSVQQSNVSVDLNEVFMLNEYTGYIVGNTGTILKTTTGGFTGISPVTSLIPEGFALYQNFPNPFNPLTNIRFDITKESKVILKVYGALGQLVSVLVDEELKAGEYSVDWNALTEPSGIYFYQLVASDFVETRKMILIR